jgi:hypothetical protein
LHDVSQLSTVSDSCFARIKDDSKLARAFRRTGESAESYATKNWGVGMSKKCSLYAVSLLFCAAPRLSSFTEYLTGPVLYGSVSEWIIQYKKGLRKFNNFERLLEQDPTGQIMQVCTKCKH